MLGGSRLRATFAVLAATTASLGLAATAGAASGSGGGGGAVIEAQDACDPATFGPDGCARTDSSGRTVTFDEAIDALIEKGAHNAWRFKSDDVAVKAGEPVTVRMGRGGEFHTFTKVAAFGPGCIEEINGLIFRSPAVNDLCNDIVDPPGAPRPFLEDAVGPGIPALTVPGAKLTRGTNLFQCMIHPWMHAKVTVE
jgi:hypothetical protein